MYVSFSKEMKHVSIYALSIAAKLRLVADCHVLQSIAVDKSKYPPGGYLVPKELFEQALDVIIPSWRGRGTSLTGSTRFGTACRRLDSQVNPLLYPGPNAVNYGQRQAPGLGQRDWCLSCGCRDWEPLQVPSTHGFNISGGDRLRWSVGALGWGNLCKLNWFLQLGVDENRKLWP